MDRSAISSLWYLLSLQTCSGMETILHSLLGWVQGPPGRTGILKTRAWKMAQVKGLISNFFQLVVLLVAPPPPTEEAPGAFTLWKAGQEQGQAGSGWDISSTSPTEKSAHLPVQILLGLDQSQEVTLDPSGEYPWTNPTGFRCGQISDPLVYILPHLPGSPPPPPPPSREPSFSFL